MVTADLFNVKERLNAAVLLTDVVDSTKLHESIGDDAARAMWTHHDRAARQLLRECHGREVGRTDGFLILFLSAADALRFAIEYHQLLSHFRPPLLARVGVHWGPVVLRENGEAEKAAGATPFEVDGLALPVAARVMAAAVGGQALFTSDALAALPKDLAPLFQVKAVGHWRLKGLHDPVALFTVGPPGATFAPPPESAKAYRVVLRDGAWQPLRKIPNNFGMEPDVFVGREDDLAALHVLFEAGARLVTVLGMGGIGKTRLAARFGRAWLGEWSGGAWFCDLSAARTLDGVAAAVAQAISVPLGRTDPIVQLAAALERRGECLLVLDNFEQVSRHAAQSLGVWISKLPLCRFLVTSREVLGLPGEHVHVLSSMSSSDSVQLFVHRVQASGVERLEDQDLRSLPKLMELLDGLPLAIELAAARARVIPPAEQLGRIRQRFRLLASRGGRHDRQATLRGTLDWSWELLSSTERSALSQLSVFEGGFKLSSAEAVVEVQQDTKPAWVEDLLQGLVEKSLVRHVKAGRFDLLRTVQDYASERLDADASLKHATWERHWCYFASLSEQNATADRCLELDNIVVACRRAAASSVPSGPAAAAALLTNAWAALRLVGPFRAGVELATPLLQREDLAPLERAKVRRVLGAVAGLAGDVEAARNHYMQGIELARRAGSINLAAQITCLQADLDIQHGRGDAARAALEQTLSDGHADENTRLMAQNALGHLELNRSAWVPAYENFAAALSLARKLGDRRREGGLESNLGTVALFRGEWDSALRHLTSGLAIADELGDRQWAGNAHCNLGVLSLTLKQYDRARSELILALDTARHMGQRRLEAVSLCNLGLVAQAVDAHLEAKRYLQQAIEVALQMKTPQLEGQFRGYLATILGSLDDPNAVACFDEAEALLATEEDNECLALLACQRSLFAAQHKDWNCAAQQLERARALCQRVEIQPSWELREALAKAEQTLSFRN